MKFRSLFLGCLLPFASAALIPASAISQETTEPRFLFETGTPAWRGERIALPPEFASDLGWIGVEQIRFAPGMFQPEAPDFFSYVLVFLLEPKTDISEAALEREFLTYYRGLAKSVMESKGQAIDPSGFSIELEKSAELEAAPESTAYTGTLKWIEPFATQKEQSLHFEVTTWKFGERPVVFSCVSPAKLDEAVPWEALRKIRSQFRLEP